LYEYIVDVIDSTRNSERYNLKKIEKYIEFGASPRASINLSLCSKTLAFFEQRNYVIPEDIKNIAKEILRHRIILTYEAESENISTDEIIEEILLNIKVP